MFKRFVLFGLLLLALSATHIVFSIGEDLSDLPGRLALVGEDYNVYTFNFAENAALQLTDDASNSRRYQWPTWSTDGRLAYFCCDLSRTSDFSTQTFISSDGIASGEVAYEADGATVIYAAWSPGNCGDGANCRDLALLVNDVVRGGLFVEMVRNRTENTTSDRIGVGSPFYYHWSNNGSQLIFHRNNRRVDIFDVAAGDVTDSLGVQSTGAYQAPVWSPIDDRVLFGVAGQDRRTTDLVISDAGDNRVLVEGIDGLVSFLWSPDGRYVAYRTIASSYTSPLIVLDVETGAVVSQTVNVGILSFFWSPDSRRIAFVTVGAQRSQSTARVNNVLGQEQQQRIQDLPTALWSVLDLETDVETELVEFSPTYEMGYLLQYFDQFAPSHRVWSPDSTQLVYSELRVEGDELRPSVNIVDVENASTNSIAEAVFGIWSFE